MSNTNNMKKDENGGPAPKILDIDALEFAKKIPKIAQKLAKNKILLRKVPDAPKLDNVGELPPPK